MASHLCSHRRGGSFKRMRFVMNERFWPRLWLSVCFFVIAIGTGSGARAQNADLPRLQTEESYVDEVTRKTTLAIDDPMAVFAFVLNSLPDRVKVYPTENYYYFSFFHNGVKYAGNIRIEPHDDGGQDVHFTYFEEETEWHQEVDLKHIMLDASRDVTVDKLDKFNYRISYKGKSVQFALNDLSNVKPAETAMAPDETFIGPIFDESGLRFYLFFNPKLKDFLYVLDESQGVADGFDQAPKTDRILIGKHTGFAFYRDHRLNRKILIGVYEANMRLNTYFDGPFDQLPDAFVQGEALRNAILAVQPDLKGHIDRYGSAPNGEVRYMIGPYLPYKDVDQLYAYHRCASSRTHAANYYDCFVYDKLGTEATRERAREAHGGRRNAR
jgi:hypothetical protein